MDDGSALIAGWLDATAGAGAAGGVRRYSRPDFVRWLGELARSHAAALCEAHVREIADLKRRLEQARAALETAKAGVQQRRDGDVAAFRSTSGSEIERMKSIHEATKVRWLQGVEDEVRRRFGQLGPELDAIRAANAAREAELLARRSRIETLELELAMLRRLHEGVLRETVADLEKRLALLRLRHDELDSELGHFSLEPDPQPAAARMQADMASLELMGSGGPRNEALSLAARRASLAAQEAAAAIDALIAEMNADRAPVSVVVELVRRFKDVDTVRAIVATASDARE
jgi:hypothetical protein